MNKSLRRLMAVASALVALAAQAHDVALRDLKIARPYARSTAPGQMAGGAYLSVENHGAADRLLSASTPVAAEVQLHTMRMEGDVMRMREIDGLDLPAGKTVVLEPGGNHFMLMGLKAPLKEGQRFPLILRFQKAGTVTVEVAVQPRDAAAPKAGMKH